MRRHALLTIVASGLAGLMMVGGSAPEPPVAASTWSVKLLLGCIHSAQDGAMATHNLHPDLIADGALNAVHPEARIYDAAQDGEALCVAVTGN
jgi:hypothetical protein